MGVGPKHSSPKPGPWRCMHPSEPATTPSRCSSTPTTRGRPWPPRGSLVPGALPCSPQILAPSWSPSWSQKGAGVCIPACPPQCSVAGIKPAPHPQQEPPARLSLPCPPLPTCWLQCVACLLHGIKSPPVAALPFLMALWPHVRPEGPGSLRWSARAMVVSRPRVSPWPLHQRARGRGQSHLSPRLSKERNAVPTSRAPGRGGP